MKSPHRSSWWNSRGDDAYENRMAALDQMKRSLRAETLHHSTGRALLRDGLASRTAAGKWKITDAGIEYIDREEREDRRVALDRRVDREKHEYIRRIIDWLEVHADLTMGANSFARHVAGALLLGLPPVESGTKWKDDFDGDGYIRAWVEAAIDGLEAIREAKAEARKAGGDLVVSYAAGPPVQSRAKERRRAAVEDAVIEQPADSNVVGLETFRQRRLA